MHWVSTISSHFTVRTLNLKYWENINCWDFFALVKGLWRDQNTFEINYSTAKIHWSNDAGGGYGCGNDVYDDDPFCWFAAAVALVKPQRFARSAVAVGFADASYDIAFAVAASYNEMVDVDASFDFVESECEGIVCWKRYH